MTHERLILLDTAYPNGPHAVLRYERDATSDPTTAQDDSNTSGKDFDYGSFYLNRTTGTLWWCADPTTSSAVWHRVMDRATYDAHAADADAHHTPTAVAANRYVVMRSAIGSNPPEPATNPTTGGWVYAERT